MAWILLFQAFPEKKKKLFSVHFILEGLEPLHNSLIVY